MGRPLNEKFFGPDAAGFQIIGSGWFEGEVAAESAFIIKQKSTTRFLVEGATSGKQMVASLGSAAPAAEGDFAVAVNGGSDFAKKITAHRISGHSGSVYVWDDIVAAADAVDDAVDADLGADAVE